MKHLTKCKIDELVLKAVIEQVIKDNRGSISTPDISKKVALIRKLQKTTPELSAKDFLSHIRYRDFYIKTIEKDVRWDIEHEEKSKATLETLIEKVKDDKKLTAFIQELKNITPSMSASEILAWLTRDRKIDISTIEEIETSITTDIEEKTQKETLSSMIGTSLFIGVLTGILGLSLVTFVETFCFIMIAFSADKIPTEKLSGTILLFVFAALDIILGIHIIIAIIIAIINVWAAWAILLLVGLIVSTMLWAICTQSYYGRY